MSGSQPRKRPSPAVYRRRRLVVLLALVAVVAVVWLLIAQPWQGAASAGENPAASESVDGADALPAPESNAQESTAAPEDPAATPTPSGTPVAPACAARNVTVEAVTDRDAYGSGEQPQLSIRLTNTGDDCILNVGTSAQVFTVSSGEDVWWRSTDCQAEPSNMVVLLAAGQTVTSAEPVAWDRTRSAQDTCDTDRAQAPAGGASYHLDVEIGGIPSTDSAQFLLY